MIPIVLHSNTLKYSNLNIVNIAAPQREMRKHFAMRPIHVTHMYTLHSHTHTHSDAYRVPNGMPLISFRRVQSAAARFSRASTIHPSPVASDFRLRRINAFALELSFSFALTLRHGIDPRSGKAGQHHRTGFRAASSHQTSYAPRMP